MSHRTGTQRRSWKERALSLLLTAALTLGLVPGLTLTLTLPASADHWADAYLDQLVDWGVMRADQTANPDADLTRAEFFAIINRAYGYTETGYIPFEDVLETDWFYDDISIAYTAGYMAGTSATTASPNDPLTREQAFCILGRNMLLAEAPGENLAFADSREISSWARGTIKAAADRYIVSGFPDNTLHPQDSISKGQMAVLVSQCLGTPIRESGTYDLGGVFGNVTITAPNVTLRNATISGDLYISGGVGLGGIKLENVDVLGRIIVSSTGESEGGEASVIMRNVTAGEMLVDNMQGKTVTIRADGITDIANTVVRTNAYLEDNNTDDKGLMHIELDGDPGLSLTLAGRIKEVVNKTPSSLIQAAQGTVARLTVDEAATNSIVEIDRNTKISEVNLDVATSVIGDGDIGRLNVNAPGSVVTMLPDDIYIRPGLNASIAGVIMDYQTAQEGSLDPRLLSGYPAAKDISPTGFRADFAGNKKGTIYWGVSYVSDGSIGEDDLISPPSYGSKAIANGSVAEPTGGEEVSAQVGNLVVGGSYYLSAILVDEMKERSPVKVISFSTPDNTVPAFAQGYPYMSRTTRSVAQVTVMPTKSCKLYYALLPQGAKAPTANEMKAAAVTGNLGYGVRDVTKNTEDVFTVNSQRLEELKTYVLYLWLTDVDGANSSAVTSLSFSIPDETPPEFVVHPHVNGTPLATSVPMAATVNEDATIFWAVVPEGDNYPLPNSNSTSPSDNVTDPDTGRLLYSEYHTDFAKLCVTSGMGALQRGQVAARANTEVTFNVTGLVAESAYDFYYVARDTAGNYTVQVYKLQGGLHTLDNSGPVVVQSFSSYPSDQTPNNPWSSTDIMLDFSENIRSETTHTEYDLLTLYNNRRENPTALRQFLEASIVLYHKDRERPAGTEPGGEPVPLYGSWPTGSEPAHWVNYENVTVRTGADGHVIVTFPGTGSVSDPSRAAVKLANGERYYFQFQNIVDTATPRANPLSSSTNATLNYYHSQLHNEPHVIDEFTTVFSQVYMYEQAPDDLPVWRGTDVSGQDTSLDEDEGGPYARADLSFRLSPQSTRNTDASNKFDILLYLVDGSAKFDLYYRITDKNRNPIKGDALNSDRYKDSLLKDYTPELKDPNDTADANGWFFLGSSRELFSDEDSGIIGGVSVGKHFNGYGSSNSQPFRSLQNFDEDLYYEFVLSITRLNEQSEADKLGGKVAFRVYIEAGQSGPINSLAESPGERESYEGRDGDTGVTNIGLNQSQSDRPKDFEISKTFTNPKPPEFASGFPLFRYTLDTSATTDDGLQYVYDEQNRKTALVEDSLGYVFVNLDLTGYIHYAVVPRSEGRPTLKRADNTFVAQDAIWDMVPTDGTDTRHGTPGALPDGVTVEYPTINQLTSSNTLTGAVIQAEKRYTSVRSDDHIDLTGLKSNTEYYIYILLEGERQGTALGPRPETVLVYKFKTARTSAPRIRLTPSGSDQIRVNTKYNESNSSRNVEANLTWRIAQRRTAYNLLAGRTFSWNNNDPTLEEIRNYYQNLPEGTVIDGVNLSEDGIDGVNSWYEALQIEYRAGDVYKTADELRKAEYGTNYNGLTLFTLFASGSEKSEMQNIIYSGGGVLAPQNDGTAETKRTTNTLTSYITDVTWTQGPHSILGNAPSGTYMFLIYGYNVNSLSDSENEDLSEIINFKLMDNVRYEDLSAPNLTDLDNSLGSVRVDERTQRGEVTFRLTFDKTLYWLSNDIFYEVTTESDKLHSIDKSSETVGMLYGMDPPTADIEVSGSPGSLEYTFRIHDIDPSWGPQQFTIMGGSGRLAALEGDPANTGIVVTVWFKKDPRADGNYWVPISDFCYVSYDSGTAGGSHKIPLLGTETKIPEYKVPTVSAKITNLQGFGSGTSSLDCTFKVNLTFSDVPSIMNSSTGPDTIKNIADSPTKSSNTTVTSTTIGPRKDFTIDVTAKDSDTITLLPDFNICETTGQASTENKIIIRVTKTTRESQSGIQTQYTQVTVSFGDEKLDEATQ